MNALGRRGNPDAVPALIAVGLHDDNNHPRWRALWAIKTIDASGFAAVPAFRAALSDPDPTTRLNAAVALAYLGQAEALPVLRQGFQNPDPFRRWEAIFSLRNIGDRRVVPALLPFADAGEEPSARVRGEAVLALGALRDPPAIPVLLAALTADPMAGVRWRAAIALSKFGDPSLAGDLKTALGEETDDRVRKEIQRTLRRLTNRPGLQRAQIPNRSHQPSSAPGR